MFLWFNHQKKPLHIPPSAPENRSQCATKGVFTSNLWLVVVFVVLGVEAVEDTAAKGEDGPAPGQAIAPVELVVDPQVDALDELDGVEDQAAGLEDDWKRRPQGTYDQFSAHNNNHNRIIYLS